MPDVLSSDVTIGNSVVPGFAKQTFTPALDRSLYKKLSPIHNFLLPLTLPLSPLACLREAASAKAGEREAVRGNSSPIEIRILFTLCKLDEDILQIGLP